LDGEMAKNQENRNKTTKNPKTPPPKKYIHICNFYQFRIVVTFQGGKKALEKN
jgi:hypothetical protein